MCLCMYVCACMRPCLPKRIAVLMCCQCFFVSAFDELSQMSHKIKRKEITADTESSTLSMFEDMATEGAKEIK